MNGSNVNKKKPEDFSEHPKISDIVVVRDLISCDN